MPQSLHILLADDDMEDAELLEEAFMEAEPEVIIHHVPNGKAVIDYLQDCKNENLPCMIVLDYNMPEMTGAEVLARLCTEPRYTSIPKIVLSTSSSSQYIKECLNNGALRYYVKPANVKELNELAKEMLSICVLS